MSGCFFGWERHYILRQDWINMNPITSTMMLSPERLRPFSINIRLANTRPVAIATDIPKLTIKYPFSPNSQSIADRDISLYEEGQLCQSVDWITIYYYYYFVSTFRVSFLQIWEIPVYYYLNKILRPIGHLPCKGDLQNNYAYHHLECERTESRREKMRNSEIDHGLWSRHHLDARDQGNSR